MCVLLLLTILLLSGCGSAPSSSKTPTQRGSSTAIAIAQVNISFDENLEKLPFDPQAERLRAASAKLSAVLGHQIEWQFAAALLPEYRQTFEAQLIKAIEQLTLDLKALQEERPRTFAWAAPALRRVECHYDASSQRGWGEFSQKAGRLDLFVHPDAYRFVEPGIASSSLDTAFRRMREGKYGRMQPEQVPVAERLEYVQFLSGYRPFAPRRADLDKPAGYLDDERARTLLALLGIAELEQQSPTDPALENLLKERILREGDYFHQAYVHHPALAGAAQKEGTFRRAERAWVSWLRREFAQLSDGDKKRALEVVYVRNFNNQVSTYGRYSDDAFPDLDRFALSVSVIEEWIESGHPIENPDKRERGLLYEHVVCPHPKDDNGARVRAPRCDYDFWDDAVSRPSSQKRLHSTIARLADRKLTESAVINVVHGGRQEALLALLRELESDERVWQWAYATAAQEYQSSLELSFVDDARRIYRDFPARRGHVLYFLSQLDRYDNERVPFTAWQRTFGPSVNEAAFRQYLSYGPSAITQLSVVWPTLGPNYSRAKPLVQTLNALTKGSSPSAFPRKGITEVIHRLCEDKLSSDLKLLRDYLQAYVREHPSQLKSFDTWLTLTDPSTRCR